MQKYEYDRLAHHHHWGKLSAESRTVGLSDAKFSNFEFCWILKNVSLLPEEVNSPEFEGGSVNELKHIWHLRLNPKKKVGNKNCLAIHLILKQFAGEKPGEKIEESVEKIVRAKIEISAYYNNQDYFLTTETEFNSKTKRSCGWSDYLYNPGLILEDIIKFKCQIWLPENATSQMILKRSRRLCNAEVSLPDKNFKKLRLDFESLYKSSLHSDITIITQDKHELKAHKSILSVRSSVFERMFSTNMKESADSIVKIDDFKKDDVEAMLEFIYTGRTKFCKDNFSGLFQIAEKYDLHDLKSDCEDGIIQILTIDNAAEMLLLADKFRAPSLKSNAMDFIIRNKNEVAKTEGFKDLVRDHGSLIAEIFLTEAGFKE